MPSTFLMASFISAMNEGHNIKSSPNLAMAPVAVLPDIAKPAVSTAPKPQKRGVSPDKLMRHFFVMAVIAMLSVGCYYTISHYFVETVQVVGQSMNPTLQESSHYLLNRWAFRNREPQRRDIVVIRDPGDNGLSVKRIIAVGGESVHFKDGKVYVNDRPLMEPYLQEETRTFTNGKATEQLIMCGKGQFFVLGDNREQSIDSRAYGPVPRENILGLLMAK